MPSGLLRCQIIPILRHKPQKNMIKLFGHFYPFLDFEENEAYFDKTYNILCNSEINLKYFGKFSLKTWPFLRTLTVKFGLFNFLRLGNCKIMHQNLLSLLVINVHFVFFARWRERGGEIKVLRKKSNEYFKSLVFWICKNWEHTFLFLGFGGIFSVPVKTSLNQFD